MDGGAGELGEECGRMSMLGQMDLFIEPKRIIPYSGFSCARSRASGGGDMAVRSRTHEHIV